MKSKIASIIIFLLFMAIIPTTIINFNNSDRRVFKDNINNENIKIAYIVSSLYKDNYADETIKAIAIICKNNYSIKPENKKTNITSYDNFNYILKIVKSIRKYNLTYNNKTVYIPFSKSSNGTTLKDDKYSYIRAVASPWDIYNSKYNKNNNCIGVSIEGLNYLCLDGASFEEALQWYLPDFKITNSHG